MYLRMVQYETFNKIKNTQKQSQIKQSMEKVDSKKVKTLEQFI